MPYPRLFAAFVMSVILLCGCVNPVVPVTAGNNTSGTGIPNPASAFCAQNGGTHEIRNGPGGQYGVCAFSDGAECEEWAYQRGECSPGKPNYCDSDSDCACGVHVETRDCFYGQKEFVDVSQQCPDYCNGIAAHLEITCVQNQCKQVQKERNVTQEGK